MLRSSSRSSALALALTALTLVACGDDAEVRSASSGATSTSASAGGGATTSQGGSASSSGGGDQGGAGGAGGGAVEHEGWTLDLAYSVPTVMEQAEFIAVAGDGHVYISGSSTTANLSVARYDPSGALVSGWPIVVPTAGTPSSLSALVVALTDGSLGVAAPSPGAWRIARYDGDGNETWSTTHNLGTNEYGTALVPTSGGGLAFLTVSSANEQACNVMAFDANGTPRPIYNPPTSDADPAQLVSCVAGGRDAATGELVLFGTAGTTVGYSGGLVKKAALHRVSADFTTASTRRGIYRGNRHTNNIGTGSDAHVSVAGDGTVFVNEWDGSYTLTRHPTSLVGHVGITAHDRWHAAHARLTALGATPDPVAIAVRQVQPAAPIELSVVATDHDPPYALAKATLPAGSEELLIDARATDDAAFVAWHSDDANGVRRVMLARYDVAKATVSGPAPLPPAATDTHTVSSLVAVSGVGRISSQTVERVVAAPDGGVYVLARDGSDYTLDRFDANGNAVTGNWPYSFTFQTFLPLFDTPSSPGIAVLPDSTAIVVHTGSFGWVTKHLLADGLDDWEAEYDTGANDFPAGVVIDGQGRIVVYGSPGSPTGTPHVDCRAIRYSAAGDIDDTFEVDVTGSPFSVCRAAAIDPLNGDLVLAGSTTIDDPGLGMQPDRALARVTSAGVMGTAAGAELSLFGPMLSVSTVFSEVNHGQFRMLSDGTRVVGLSSPDWAHHARFTALDASGARLGLDDWTTGVLLTTTTQSDYIVTAAQASPFHPIMGTVRTVDAAGLAHAATFEVDPPSGYGRLAGMAGAPHDDSFWLIHDDNGALQLKRFVIQP